MAEIVVKIIYIYLSFQSRFRDCRLIYQGLQDLDSVHAGKVPSPAKIIQSVFSLPYSQVH